MTPIANSRSWKCEPFKEGVHLAYQPTFTNEQFARLKTGLIPREMEDKWFIYYEDPYLFLHRSWTGQSVYRIKLKALSDRIEVEEVLWSKEIADKGVSDMDYQVRLLDFLISNLLLGQSKAFPALPGDENPFGIFQHHVSGTAYPEFPQRKKKVWWRIW